MKTSHINASIVRDKKYRYDDVFKAKARAHQFAFRENILNDYYEEKNPQVILSPNAARQGLIFCDTYRDLILNRVKRFGTSALFSNMLRSEHIPYNIFVPMEEDLDNARLLFGKIIGIEISGDIQRLHHIHLYPQGNVHFHQYALPEYKSLLTPKGKNSFIDLTYECLFDMLSLYFTSAKQKEWIKYLYQRYIQM